MPIKRNQNMAIGSLPGLLKIFELHIEHSRTHTPTKTSKRAAQKHCHLLGLFKFQMQTTHTLLQSAELFGDIN